MILLKWVNLVNGSRRCLKIGAFLSEIGYLRDIDNWCIWIYKNNNNSLYQNKSWI